MNDIIKIEGLKIFAHHGVLEEEKINGQEFIIDISMVVDIHESYLNDDLNKTVNYDLVANMVNNYTITHVFNLIETLGEGICKLILKNFDKVNEVSVTVHKPSAPIKLDFNDVKLKVNRKWHEAYIALGSNMGDKEKYINDAIDKLSNEIEIKDIKVSKLITTKPYGGVSQDDFLNGALKLKTLLTPSELLDLLHRIESEANRVRDIHWGPRTLDLDILFYDDITMYTDSLIIPHIDMQNRIFVLEPLMELCPAYFDKMTQKTVYQMYTELTNKTPDDV